MKGKNKKRSWKQIVSVLSCVVVFCTTYALILPAVTMSKDTYCQKEEHTHTEQCYKSEEPLCGLEEGETKEAHVHDESCYENVEVARNLTCSLEEDETHVHSEDCYQSEFETRLTCDQEEGEAVEGHTHGDECYKSEEPICNKEEHEHVHECYSNKEDVEDPNNWAEAYKDINKEEDAKTRILTVAKNELGYKENEANFEVDEKDEEHPYTRYGHLYEDMYGDWNNYFTGYVLKYANVQMNFDKDIDKWQNKTINDQKEEGEEGNVVFFRDEEGKTRTGIVTNIDELKKEIRVIEGDVEGEVKEERVNKDRVIAYLDDQVTIDDLDTPLAGEGAEKEESLEDKKVTIEDNEDTSGVQPGDVVTLKANTIGFEENATLLYQWQYNDSENLENENWKDIENETNESISIEITEENITYLWRVRVEEIENPAIIGTPINGQFLRKVNIGIRGFQNFNEESVDSDEEHIYFSGPKSFLTANNEENDAGIELQNATDFSEIIIKKQWQYDNAPENAEVNVELKYANHYALDSQTKRPMISEDLPDTNFKIQSFTLSAKNNWESKITKEEITRILQEGGIQDIDLENLYLLESYEGYTPSYSTTGTKEVISYTTQSTTSLSAGQFIITDSSGKYALDKNGFAKEINGNASNITSDLIWTVEKESNYSSYYSFKNEDGKYLDAINSKFNNSTSYRSVSINENKQYFELTSNNLKKKNESLYINFKNNGFEVDKEKKSSNKIYFYKVTGQKTIKQNIMYVTNNKNNTGGYGHGEIKDPQQILHSKTIDYLGDGTSNEDAKYASQDLSDKYRLYLDAGPIAGESPIDLYIVIDISGSMESEKSEDKITEDRQTYQRLEYLKKILGTSNSNSGILKNFIDANEKNTVEIITFGEQAKVALQKTNNINDIHSTVRGLDADGGTNYHMAINTLNHELDSKTKGNQQYVIFLSDGVPTFYGYNICSDGSNTTVTNAKVTSDAIDQLHSDHSDVTISTIALKATSNAFLRSGQNTHNCSDYNTQTVSGLVWGDDGGSYEANKSGDLKKQLELMSMGPRCTNGIISDTLSQYVDFDKTNIQLLVRAIPNDGITQPTELFRTNEFKNDGSALTNSLGAPELKKGGNKEGNWTYNEMIQSVSIQGKTVTLKFNPEWELDASYKFEISFNVQTQPIAYTEYAKDSTYGGVTGDPNSDYGINHTSSQLPGFYSNADSLLEYEYDGKTFTTDTGKVGATIKPINPYQKPVIQAEVSNIIVNKVDSENNTISLSGAEFMLYRKSDDGDKTIPNTTLKGFIVRENIALVSDKDGKISLGKLYNGDPYYLVETLPPDGYTLSAGTIKLQMQGNKIQIWTNVDKNGEGIGDPQEVNATEASSITFNVENTPGSELPNTGGTGTKLFTFSGGAIIATTCLMYGYKKKSKRNRKGGQN